MYEKTYTSSTINPNVTPVGPKKRDILTKSIIILTVLFLVAVTSFLFRHPKLQLRTFTIEGVEVVDPERINFSLRESLSGYFLWVFPRSSIFLTRSAMLEKIIAQSSTRIESVQVTKTGAQTGHIKIQEYKPAYIWCQMGREEDCYFMDAKGVVYIKAPSFSGSVYTKIITREIKELPFLPLDSKTVSRIALYKESLPKISLYPESFVLTEDKELVIHAPTKNNTDTLFRVRRDAEPFDILEGLSTVFRTKEFLAEYDSQKKLLYIDMRFTNKVAYKFE